MSNADLGAVARNLDGSAINWEQRQDVESLENLVKMLSQELNVSMIPGNKFDYNEATKQFIYNRDLLLKLPAAAGAGLTFHNMGHARHSSIDKNVFSELRSRSLKEVCEAISYQSGGKIPAASVFGLLEAAEDERMEYQVRQEYDNLGNTYLPRHDQGWRRDAFIQKFQALQQMSQPGQTDQAGNPVYWNRAATALRAMVSGAINKDLLPEDMAWPQEFCDELASLRKEKSAGDIIRKLTQLVPKMVQYRQEPPKEEPPPPNDGDGGGQSENKSDGMDNTNTERSSDKGDKSKGDSQSKPESGQDESDDDGDDSSGGSSGSSSDESDDGDDDADSDGGSDSSDDSDDDDSSDSGDDSSESDDSGDEDGDDGDESGESGTDGDDDQEEDDEQPDDVDPELQAIKEQAEQQQEDDGEPAAPTPQELANEKRYSDSDFDLMSSGNGAGFGIEEANAQYLEWQGPAWSLIRSTCSNILGPVRKKIQQELKDNEIADKERGFKSGRFDGQKYVRSLLSGGKSFYSRRTDKAEQNYAFYILEDVSVSMKLSTTGLKEVPEFQYDNLHNNKRQNRAQFATRLAVTFFEALSRFKEVKTAIGTFGARYVPLKDFSDPLDSKMRQRIINNVYRPTGGDTMINIALMKATEKLKHVKAHGKMIIILTDGMFGDNAFSVKQTIAEAKRNGIDIVIFTVGVDTKSALQFVDEHHVAQLTDDNVGIELGKHLRRMVKGAR